MLEGVMTPPPGMSAEEREKLAAQVAEEVAEARRFLKQENVPGWAAMRWTPMLIAAGRAWPIQSTVSGLRELADANTFSSALRFAIVAVELENEKRKDGSEYFSEVAGEVGAIETLAKLLAPELWKLADALTLIRAWVPVNAEIPSDNPHARGALISAEEAHRHGTPGMVVLLSAEGPTEEDGMLSLDARFAGILDGFGEPGAHLAKRWRDDARGRWSRLSGKGDELLEDWLVADDTKMKDFEGPRVVRYLARALWRHVVGPRLRQERHQHPALLRTVHVEATLFHSRGPKFDEKSATLSFDGKKLAERIGATFDIEVIQRGLGLLGSVASHELFHWEVTQGHEQHRSGAPSPHILDVEGGWAALAELLGLKPSKHAADLRALVIAQMSFGFTFPDGSKGNMLVMNERPAMGGRRAHVRLELGSVLMPGYVHTRGLPDRERKLVPLLRQRVPLYGRPNEHGEQRTMSLALMAEFRDRARELAEDGGAKLLADDFTRLGDRSGLVRKLIRPVVEHWIGGDTHAPPFLKCIARDRYTLSDVHTAEREFLEAGGRRELQGAEKGKRSAANREANLGRIGRGKRLKK